MQTRTAGGDGDGAVAGEAEGGGQRWVEWVDVVVVLGGVTGGH